MKITDYSKVSGLVAENVFLLDGPDGTKTILATDLAKALLSLLNSKEFVSGVEMSDLDQADTVLKTDSFLIGTEAGNKAVDASVLAQKLIGMLTSSELVEGLKLSELTKTTTLAATDHVMAGLTAGNRAMTASDLAKALVKLLSSTELVNGLKLSELSKTTTLASSDYVMAGLTDGNRAMTAENLAKALVKMLSSAELVEGLKLSELTATTTLGATDNVLVGLTGGNRGMTGKNLALALPKLLTPAEFISPLTMSQLAQATELTNTDNILIGTSAGNKYMKAEDAFYAMLDAFGPPEIHRTTYRGKNLGTSVTPEQKAAIQAGTFKGLFVGDYWVIGGVNWRIADMDYFYRCGDTEFTKHHVVIVPDTSLYSAKMNDSNITTGGYMGSKMYTEYINQAKTTIASAFGDLVLTHKDILTNAVTDGHPSGYAWVESTVELMNEIMVYGTTVYTPASDGVTIPALYTTGKQQFALFALDPKKVNTRYTYWLRDVVSVAAFALVGNSGGARYNGASNSYGVRPYFCVGS